MPRAYTVLTRAFILGLIGLTLAARLEAQAPTQDKEMIKRRATTVMLRFGEWYMQAKYWRDRMLEEANTMVQQTRQLTNLRRMTQDRLVGEGGVIGKHLPHLGLDELGIEDPSAYCAVDSTGTSKNCGGVVGALKRFDRIYDSAYVPFKAQLVMGDSRRQIFGMVGQRYEDWQFDRKLRNGDLFKQINASLDMATLQAQIGATLDSLNTKSQAFVDTLKRENIDSLPLSSGRASQLAAISAVAEAQVLLELARQRIANLQNASMNASATSYDVRRHNRPARLGF